MSSLYTRKSPVLGLDIHPSQSLKCSLFHHQQMVSDTARHTWIKAYTNVQNTAHALEQMNCQDRCMCIVTEQTASIQLHGLIAAPAHN